ncbi:MAG TPA: hypothetical protein VMV74_11565 [Bacteroidales bacterium]|nr:hypothetical protein [Bacteroidales bacterium]
MKPNGSLTTLIGIIFILFIIYLIIKNYTEKQKKRMDEKRRFGKK